MRIAGDAVLHAPVGEVWDALLDPAILVRTIPGCERLESTGEHTYAMTVTAGVASITGTYAGTVELRDLDRPRSLTMRIAASGAPGTIGADVNVTFSGDDDHTTRLAYEADAVVGGTVGGVGQRMLTSVGRRRAGEFFTAVDDVLTGQAPAAAVDGGRTPSSGTDSEVGTVFTAPARTTGRDDFSKGLVVGGGLVLLGVVAGAVASRRRR
ncbi:MAG: carbon monoxide dehydrogenase [Propionibacteriales bacterium]|nr:carbon monoxide dehydrogenase [Propionibacteriales bacterium]